jgi:hypothetical protein
MRRHEFDPVSFVFGMIFAVLGLAFLSGRVDLGDLHLRWLWPIPLIALGLALLVTTQRRDGREDSDPPAPEPVPQRQPEPGETDDVPADAWPRED